MEPRLNEVPREWGNLFVISKVRHIENLDITNLLEDTQHEKRTLLLRKAAVKLP